MSVKVVGVCSICGGRVMVRTALHSVVTPKPSCTTCGAVAKEGLPKIPMVQRGEKRPETNMMWKWHGKRVMRFEP